MPLAPGDPAPAVTAPNQDGEPVTVDVEGPTVLYFYPADDTPGCTTEAEQFQREADAYADAGVAVYGVSTDDVDSHHAFAEQYDLEFDLLADPDAEVVDAYEVLTDRGRAARTTFVLLDGEVHRVYEAVKPDGHPRDVLADLLEDGVVSL